MKGTKNISIPTNKVHTYIYRQTNSQTDRRTDGHTSRQTRKIEILTGEQTDRQIRRQANRLLNINTS